MSTEPDTPHRRSHHWLIALLAVVVWAGTGCSGSQNSSSEGESCERVGDCSGNSVCWDTPRRDGRCVDRCDPQESGTSSCNSDERCVSVAANAGGCVPDPWLVGDAGSDTGRGRDTSDPAPADSGTNPRDTGIDDPDTRIDDPDTAGGCSPACGRDETCRDGTCVSENRPKFVQLKDRTREENRGKDRDGNGTDDATDACDRDGTTGSDLFGIELLDRQGEHLAWADTVAVRTTAQSSDGTGYSSRFSSLPGLNGAEPSLEGSSPENACPSGGFSDNVAPLGCDGTLVVGFPNADGSWRRLRENQTIRVYEYGQQCFENCDPTEDFAICAIEYLEVKACNPEASERDLQAATPDADRDYPGCTHDTVSFTSSGYGQGSLIFSSSF